MPKRNQPETSREAYASLQPDQIREIYLQIKWALSQIGSGHFEDIAAALKLPKDRIWRRLKEMEDLGMIYRPGTKKVLSTGRNAMVWTLVKPDGNNEVLTEKSLPGKSIADYSRKILQSKLF
jgi:DNA-binding Lrp family transcriptional regulator